jgi:thymidylate synthase
MRHVLDRGGVQRDEDVQIREVLGLTVEVTRPACSDEIVERYGDKAVIARTIDKFANGAAMPDRPFTYGERIYAHGGIDQFEWLVDRLRAKRETKSATIGLLVPGSQAANLPCLTTLDAKIRQDRLELQFFFRSQNIFGRQYANLLALAKLQADLAAKCAVAPGKLAGYVASAHIYAFDVEVCHRILAGELLEIQDRYYLQGPKSIRTGAA